jgi:ferredoxin
MAIQIDEERCVGCGCCMDGCNVGALEFHPEKEKAWVNDERCTECKSCSELCAEDALSV